jgi:uncharacterized protein YlxW (UPF0749 family)
MSWADFLGRVMQLTKMVNLAEEKIKRLEDDNRYLRDDNAELRKEIAALTTRVAVLEEGRKTTAVEVKLALTETIAAWEIKRAKDEARKGIPSHE